MRRRLLPVLAVPGALLIVAGQLLIAYRDDVTPIVGQWGPAGRALSCLWSETFACGVVLGLALFLTGALLIAFAIGVPAPAQRDHNRLQRVPSFELPRGSAVCFAIAGVAAIITAWACATPRPVDWTVAGWLVSLTAGLLGVVIIDRVRQTPLSNPFTAWEWTALALLVAAELVLVAHDLTHWRWAGTPDETDFFAVAKSIAEGKSDRPLLSESAGVFGVHSVLNSAYQALFMRLFGINLFGWRLSSVAALAAALPCVYLLARELWSKRAGFIATILLGSAQLAVGFAHFGYNNIHVLPVVVGALALLAWAHRRDSLTGYYLAGGLAGLSFHTFYSARLAPLLLVLLAMNFERQYASRDRWRAATGVLGVVLTALPMWMHFGEMTSHMLQFSGMTGGRAIKFVEYTTITDWFRSSANWLHLLQHWALSLIYGVWFKDPRHLQWNPIVDPISAGLAAVGIWLAVGSVRRRGGLRFLLVTYFVSAFLVGATSNDFRPPLTRLLFLAPFTAMLAAVALDQLLHRLTPRLAWALGSVLVIGAAVWNAGALHYNITHRHHGYGDGITAELVRVARLLPATTQIVYAQRGDSDSSVDLVLDAYEMLPRFSYLCPFGPEQMEKLAAVSAPAVVFYDLRDPGHARVVEETLTRRFPSVQWQDSDPGQRWNMRYFYVAAGVRTP